MSPREKGERRGLGGFGEAGISPLEWSPVEIATALLVGTAPFLVGYIVRIGYLLCRPEIEPYFSRPFLVIVLALLSITLASAIVAFVISRRLRHTRPDHPVFTRAALGVWFGAVGLATYFVGPFTSPILAVFLAGAIAALVFFETEIAWFGICIGSAIVVGTGIFERLEVIPYGPLFVSVLGGEFRPEHTFVLMNVVVLTALFAALLTLFSTVMRMWRRSDAEVRKLAITDPLTGLANRRHFIERLELELARAERYGDSVALVLMDIDHFKEVNDRFGHVEGDRALVSVAREALTPTLRNVDLAGRYGGEEFAVLLPATDLEGGRAVAERLRALIARVEIAGGSGPRISASFGVASAPHETIGGVIDLVRAADEALYEAKHGGRDRVVLAETSREAPPRTGAASKRGPRPDPSVR